MQTCRKCGTEKPITEYPLRGKTPESRRDTICRQCRNAGHRKWHAENRERRNAEARARRVESPETGRQYAHNHRRRHLALHLIAAAKRRAAKKEIPFDLEAHTLEIRTRVENMTCELTGIALSQPIGTGSREWNSVSLDRVDNSRGYVYDNIRIVCWAMNAAMGTWGLQKLKELVAKTQG